MFWYGGDVKKNNKLHRLWFIYAITPWILIASLPISTIPLMLNTSHNNELLSHTKDNKTVQTGKITHDANVPVVDNLVQIELNSLQIGDSSSIIVNRNGVQEIYVWGNNNYGQLGLGENAKKEDTTNRSEPTLLNAHELFGDYLNIQIKIGSDYLLDEDQPWSSVSSYAIVDRLVDKVVIQELYTWGYNKFGQLGHTGTNNTSIPTKVSKSDLGNYDNILSVYGNNETLFVITEKNGSKELYASGYNKYGQLGNGLTNTRSKFQLIPKSELGNYRSIINFQFADDSCALTIVDNITGNSSIYVWGRNDYGQLGLEHKNPVLRPTLFLEFDHLIIQHSKIVFRKSSYLWNKNTHDVYVWGNNEKGQLGLKNTTNMDRPVWLNPNIPGPKGIVKKIQIDLSSFLLVEQNGIDRMFVWGENNNSKLGLGDQNPRLEPTRFNLGIIGAPPDNSLFNVKSFYIKKSVIIDPSIDPVLASQYPDDGNIGYALTETIDGTALYGWGQNKFKQLGVAGQQNTPIKINLPTNLTIVDAVVNQQTKLIVENKGVKQAYALGRNNFGQLGLANTADIVSPTRILNSNESYPLAYKNNTYPISAGDAFNSFYGDITNIYNKDKLLEYIDISTFPINAKISIAPNPPNPDETKFFNSKEGFITLTIVTNTYFKLFSKFPVNDTKTFEFIKISGFKKVSDVPIVTNFSPILDKTQFFNGLYTNGNLNREFLEQYINLDCIPLDAVLTVESLVPESSPKIDFVLKTDKVYRNNGISVKEEYSQNFSFPTEKPLDQILIISLIAGGILILLIIFSIIYMSKRRIK